MKREEVEFLLGEFIGERVEVSKSSCRDWQGMRGTIVDETRNTFLLETVKGRKVIPKASSSFLFENGFEVKGKMLVGQPEERTKNLWKKLRKKI